MNEQYKVVVYTDQVSLEKGLNRMYGEGYKPAFVQRTSTGYVTVIYEKQ